MRLRSSGSGSGMRVRLRALPVFRDCAGMRVQFR
jgi:hypothetical protein